MCPILARLFWNKHYRYCHDPGVGIGVHITNLNLNLGHITEHICLKLETSKEQPILSREIYLSAFCLELCPYFDLDFFTIYPLHQSIVTACDALVIILTTFARNGFCL